MRFPFKLPWLLVGLWVVNSLALFFLITRLDFSISKPTQTCVWIGFVLAGLEDALIQHLKGS